MKGILRTAALTAVSVALIASATSSSTAGIVHDTMVSDNPSNHTPNVNQGAVNSLAEVGDTMVAGGKFTSVSPPTPSTEVISRTNLFAFDADTGEISDTFLATPNKTVMRVVSSGDGQTVYVAGLFTLIDGQKVPKIARLDATTGQLVSSFDPPAINGKINDMVLLDGVLYLGGAFTKVGPNFKSGLVALDAQTGHDTGKLASTFANTFNGGTMMVKALDVSDDGSRLVAVGNFRTVDGQSRVQLAVMDTSVTPAVVAPWSTTRYSTSCASVFDTYMRDVSISPTGGYFVVVATGAFAGGAGSGTLCDAAVRWELSPNEPNRQPTWVDYTGGDTLYSVEAMGRLIYLGGHQRWLNNPFAGDRAGPGAVKRTGIAMLDPRNGLPMSWNPTRARGVGLREFVPSTDGVWIGHDTNRLGGEERRRIAFMPFIGGGTPLPDDNTGSLPGDVYTAGSLFSGSDTMLRRGMTPTSVTSSTTVGNGGLDWSGTRGAFMVDGRLYTATSTGFLTVRTFDGTNYGTSTAVDLHNLTAFADEMKNMTGMFFDRVNARLYFTLSGSNRLYYRYFLPESNIVGAVRFDAGGPSAGVDWVRAGGMFLAGNRLYVADRVDGSLASVEWNGTGPVNGTRVVVSGPGVDGHSWQARSIFLQAD